jgi:hypothetical protein
MPQDANQRTPAGLVPAVVEMPVLGYALHGANLGLVCQSTNLFFYGPVS